MMEPFMSSKVQTDIIAAPKADVSSSLCQQAGTPSSHLYHIFREELRVSDHPPAKYGTDDAVYPFISIIRTANN
ncbi:hypothetical protein AAHC03_025972 [Spirometra sp. Aus1]